MSKIWVAVSQRNTKFKWGDMSALENNYLEYFEEFDFRIIQIPNITNHVESYFDEIPIKAVILTGGGDVGHFLPRDKTEKKLIEIAIRRKLPVFGICRGLQFINIFFGGKLKNIKGHVATTHEIKIIDPKLSKLLGKEKIEVNSYHNQGITKSCLSPKLTPFAISNDGIVEGVCHKKYQIAGIMWHPERSSLNGVTNKKIIKNFIGL